MNDRYESRPPRHDRPHHGGAPRPRSKPINIQDGFLFESLKEGRRLVFLLITDNQIKGQIKRFDRYAVLVDDGEKEILIYKHAISGITAVDPGPPGQR